MATKTETPKAKTVLSDEHKKRADFLLANMLYRARDSKQFPALALEAHRAATAMEEITAAIEAGELSAEPEKHEPPEYITIPVLVKNPDESWVPMTDPLSGEKIMETVACDRDAYAPNLPADHPINLRFKPRDGVPVAERIAKHHADKDAEKERRQQTQKQQSLLSLLGSALMGGK